MIWRDRTERIETYPGNLLDLGKQARQSTQFIDPTGPHICVQARPALLDVAVHDSVGLA